MSSFFVIYMLFFFPVLFNFNDSFFIAIIYLIYTVVSLDDDISLNMPSNILHIYRYY